jgi:peroxiredoxin Q/BCP
MGSLYLKNDSDDSIAAKIGEKAPDFALNDEKGNEWRLSDHLGQVTAILFYPKNETLVCTKQLCSLRDNWSEYLETKAVVIGVSPGTVEEHREFAKRYRLPLPLLVDTGRKITEIFSKHWLYPLSFTRGIVVIDAKGIIRTKQIMLRAFRPTDRSVITAIHAARADALYDIVTNQF